VRLYAHRAIDSASCDRTFSERWNDKYTGQRASKRSTRFRRYRMLTNAFQSPRRFFFFADVRLALITAAIIPLTNTMQILTIHYTQLISLSSTGIGECTQPPQLRFSQLTSYTKQDTTTLRNPTVLHHTHLISSSSTSGGQCTQPQSCELL
jgi:hypothetical protein